MATIISTLSATDAAAHASPPAVHYARPGSTLPFSQAVRAGDFVFASGQIGVEQDGTVPAAMERQAQLALDHTRDVLALAGVSMSDVVKCTVMLTDMTQWPAFNAVYAAYFTPGKLPARSAFGTTALAFGAGVELECLAYKPVARK